MFGSLAILIDLGATALLPIKGDTDNIRFVDFGGIL